MAELRRRPRPHLAGRMLLAALLVIMSNVLVAALCITVTVHGQREAARAEASARAEAARTEAAARAAQQREADLRWCPIVLALVPQPGDPRPAPGRGQIIADSFVNLAAQFNCHSATGGDSRLPAGRDLPR